ncbi:extracellular solute-binding protein [Alkalihalobacillus trypoxylicola]|uniref:ABC transporter substrate-binding protein n=1 Tax=Alkalihalobacillus trypoxylicola TaxID=519424 RepID=A0A162FCH4_9BACI|nr:extracellular solute-binding protein [Alkalihalobacillus trypoxylicola]KYG35285.1 hypothetical protein AZF04_02815 [Alkalihalobacillus trypoxylicola]
MGKFEIIKTISLVIIIYLLCTNTSNILAAEETFSGLSYEEYLESYPESIQPAKTITIDAEQLQKSNQLIEIYENVAGQDGKAIYSDEEGEITWEFYVEDAGFYHLEFYYFPVEGKGMDIVREIHINGELPFDQADYISFSRIWKDDGTIQRDVNDNDRRPSQIEEPQWVRSYVQDDMGFIDEPYLFYFKEGVNTLSIKSIQDMMLIHQLVLKQKPFTPTYDESLIQYEEKNYEVISLEEDIIIQAEQAKYKSDAMLYPTYDRSTPATIPSHPSKIRLNTIGGEQWKEVGQWISWEVDVPESGLYQLGAKFWQNFKSGRYVARSLKINGEIPFQEMNRIHFNYGADWDIKMFGEDEPYLFYLEEGMNEIQLEVVLGDLAEMIQQVSDSVFQLNYAYRQMLMIIGSTPDIFRDYQLDTRVPEAIQILEEQKMILEDVSNQLASNSGQRGITTSVLDTLVVQLQGMYAQPESIPDRWATFQANISSLGAWVLEMQEQPLQLDYLFVTSEELDKPKATTGFLENSVYAIQSFFASFTEDYSSIGAQSDEAVTVWVNSRDYGNIINSLVENDFNLKSEVDVNVQIVDSETLLPATLAGEGPDVALQVGIGEPVNYAVRNAVVDLTEFNDFDQVATRFSESALVPYQFNEGVYALPETQTFPMMFYRTDIFDELNIEAPNTWEDLYRIMPDIQKNNMNIGIPINGVTGTGSVQGIESTLSSYTMFLYQNEGELYTREGERSLVDEEESINAFRKWTSLYVNYSIPVLYDFANRLRTGEMPIGIADYSTYNYLSVFAPELRGMWEMVPVPGTIQSDGTINRAVSSSGVSSIILKTSEKKEESWEFIKWWTSAEVQAKFGKELESIIGVAARYASANQEAAELLGWTSSVYRNLLEQWDWVVGNPEVPGGYFTPRHIENAFRKVYNDLDDPRETILDYTQIINLEIEHKRKEFGLDQ